MHVFKPILCLYFLCFYEYNIHRVCVYKWAYCWVKKKKITDLPTLFFNVGPRYANTTTKSTPLASSQSFSFNKLSKI